MMRILLYRPRFFGKPMGHLENSALRGSSEWSVGERELFAAWVSAKNRCRFCESAHRAIASRAMSQDIVDAVIAGHPPESLGPKVLAMLPFLEKVTISPANVTPGDIFPLRTVGISDAAIVDAAYICMIFCTLNRVADALDCEVMSPPQLEKVSKVLLDKGYDL
jgi:uncharacterized peroxidase-related enzyme